MQSAACIQTKEIAGTKLLVHLDLIHITYSQTLQEKGEFVLKKHFHLPIMLDSIWDTTVPKCQLHPNKLF